MLAVHDVDVLGMVAARDADDPDAGDVRAGNRVPPPGLLLLVGEVPHLPAGRLDPPGDPPRAAGPVPGPAHQVRDLRDVLVVLGAAVLAGAGLPRVRGDLADGILVSCGDQLGGLHEEVPCPPWRTRAFPVQPPSE